MMWLRMKSNSHFIVMTSDVKYCDNVSINYSIAWYDCVHWNNVDKRKSMCSTGMSGSRWDLTPIQHFQATRVIAYIMHLYANCLLMYPGLVIDEATISVTVSPDSPGNPPAPVFTGLVYNTAADFLYFNLQDNLVVGEKYVLIANFTGNLRDPGQDGFYWDSYYGLDSRIKWVLWSNMDWVMSKYGLVNVKIWSGWRPKTEQLNRASLSAQPWKYQGVSIWPPRVFPILSKTRWIFWKK